MEENMQENMEEVTETETEQEKQMRETVQKTLEKVRNTALIEGAKMICSVVLQTINKHTAKSGKTSLRDYERCVKEIINFVSIPLKTTDTETKQNDLEENKNDETAE